MSIFAHLDGLGAALEEALADSILEWRSEYPKYRGAVDVLAEHVKLVRTTFSLMPNGVCFATVEVEARSSFDSNAYIFRFKRAGSGSWVRSAHSLSER